MTIDDLINAVASIEARAIARHQAMTSSDALLLDMERVDLDGDERSEGHYWRIMARRAPQTVAESFDPLLNC